MRKPRLMDYNVKALVVLWNQSGDEFFREDVKKTLVMKLNGVSSSLIYIINSFINSNGVMREVYAEILMIRMYEESYRLSSTIADEIISLVSMDTLTKYGMECSSLEFSEKCKNEFWDRAIELEDKSELIKKRNVDSKIKLRRRLIIEKEKGDKND